MKKNKIAVIVGRFQNFKLHAGHKALFKYANDNYDEIIVGLGTAYRKSCKTDPLNVYTRTRLIKSEVNLATYQKMKFVKLMDNKCDIKWSENLDFICEMSDVLEEGFDFLVGRDSFKPHYHGKYQNNFVEIPEIEGENATKYRENLQSWIRTAHQKSFAIGAIWATQEQYPHVQPTVDIAAIREMDGKHYLLLGRKPSEDGWRLPGGFVDPTDESYAHAAARELGEETNIICGFKRLQYVDSMKLADWRYRKGPDGVMTTLFVAPFKTNTDSGNTSDSYIVGSMKAGDDLAECKWVELKRDLATGKYTERSICATIKLETVHEVLWKSLVKNYLSKLDAISD